ncbi:hypothetical protein V6N12_025401 [Hibiscus sabdariffa]|uniref:Uncharacterized protein n=1 Tax=Hibiscus sabdariffa TaxID=183260 RepID=A0ABR2CK68_9ROSI
MTDETLSRFFIFSTGSGELTIENGRERGLHWSIFLQSLDSISGPGTQLKDIPNESGLFFSDIVNCFSGFQPQRLKRNIGQFSGYVWVQNEQEKQKTNVQEKIENALKKN